MGVEEEVPPLPVPLRLLLLLPPPPPPPPLLLLLRKPPLELDDGNGEMLSLEFAVSPESGETRHCCTPRRRADDAMARLIEVVFSGVR